MPTCRSTWRSTPSTTSRPSSTSPGPPLRTTTESGWRGPTLRSARASSTRHGAGSIDAWQRDSDDPLVWTTVLDLALATDDVGLAEKAAGHLTTAQLPTDRVVHVRAWFAAQRHDAELERTILAAHLEHEPCDTVAIERLSELEIQAGQAAHVAELRRRKTELDRARRTYSHRVGSDFKANARELAGYAETLGHGLKPGPFWPLCSTCIPKTTTHAADSPGSSVSGSTRPPTRLLPFGCPRSPACFRRSVPPARAWIARDPRVELQ